MTLKFKSGDQENSAAGDGIKDVTEAAFWSKQHKLSFKYLNLGSLQAIHMEMVSAIRQAQEKMESGSRYSGVNLIKAIARENG